MTPLVKAACLYFGVSEEAFYGRARFNEIIRTRAAVVYVMRNRDVQSFPQIGKRLGRDHSTIIFSLRRAENLLADDKDFADFVRAQMSLPKYSPRAVIMEMAKADPPPPARLSKPVLPPCPQHLIRMRKPASKFIAEGKGPCAVSFNEDGEAHDEYMDKKRMRKGSIALVQALYREHPERFAA